MGLSIFKDGNLQGREKFTVSKVCEMTYRKGNCAEFGPVNVFQFKSDSVKPISCIRIKVRITNK